MKPAFRLVLRSLLISFPARAQEYEHGTTLLCDGQKRGPQ
jgi:hypothetical protein